MNNLSKLRLLLTWNKVLVLLPPVLLLSVGIWVWMNLDGLKTEALVRAEAAGPANCAAAPSHRPLSNFDREAAHLICPDKI